MLRPGSLAPNNCENSGPKLLSQPRTPCVDALAMDERAPSAQEAPGPAPAYRAGKQVRALGDGRSKKIVRLDLPEFSSTSVFSSARSRDHVPEDVLDVDLSEELALSLLTAGRTDARDVRLLLKVSGLKTARTFRSKQLEVADVRLAHLRCLCW